MKITDKYLELMCCVMEADGVVTAEEARCFEAMLDISTVSAALRAKYVRRLKRRPPPSADSSLKRVAAGIQGAELLWFVRDAFIMSDADGKITDDELRVVMKFVEFAGIPKTRFPKIKLWGIEQAKQVRRGLGLFS